MPLWSPTPAHSMPLHVLTIRPERYILSLLYEKGSAMARRCDISGVTHQNGNRVSHANNKTHHKFDSNLQLKRLYVPELGKSVRIRVSTRILRTIDKLGFLQTLKKHKLSLADISK